MTPKPISSREIEDMISRAAQVRRYAAFLSDPNHRAVFLSLGRSLADHGAPRSEIERSLRAHLRMIVTAR